jgi:cytochrome c oxidase assembly protein subunit 15
MTRAPRRRISLAAYRRITLSALVALAVIVVTGAAVRLTGSGLGCEDWPKCNDNRIVAPMDDLHAVVEFVNRMFTGVVSISVILAVLGSLLLEERRRDLTRWSLGLVAGVIGQIVLGGLVVLFDLSPWLVMGHFVLSMVLLWNAVVLHHRASVAPTPRAPELSPSLTNSARALVLLSMVTLGTGTIVTGSGPHSGSHDEELVDRLPFAVGHVARLHGIAMVFFLAATVLFAVLVRPGTRHASAAAAERTRRDVTVLLTVLVAQAAVGYTQYFSDVPPLLVGIHVAGAATLWITVVWFYLRRFTPVTVTATSSAAHPAAVWAPPLLVSSTGKVAITPPAPET